MNKDKDDDGKIRISLKDAFRFGSRLSLNQFANPTMSLGHGDSMIDNVDVEVGVDDIHQYTERPTVRLVAMSSDTRRTRFLLLLPPMMLLMLLLVSKRRRFSFPMSIGDDSSLSDCEDDADGDGDFLLRIIFSNYFVVYLARGGQFFSHCTVVVSQSIPIEKIVRKSERDDRKLAKQTKPR